MFCSNCGTQNADNAVVCASCGAPLAAAQPQYQQPQPQYQQPQYQQPQYQQPQPQYQQPLYQPAAPAMPMNWFKFLIYFSLFAGAALNIINGILGLTGGQYSGDADLVYAVFGGLQIVDIIYGLFCVALGAFMIYVRFQLAGYRANGPKYVLVVYAAAASISFIYAIAVSVIISESYSGFDTSSIISSAIVNIITSVIMIVANKVYFDKRKFMFVN